MQNLKKLISTKISATRILTEIIINVIIIIIIIIIVILKMMMIIIITKTQISPFKNVLFEPLLRENESISPANQVKNRSSNNLAVIIITNVQGINMSSEH